MTNSLGHNSPISAEALVDIFDRLDSDRSGVLHLHEFMNFFSTQHIKQVRDTSVAYSYKKQDVGMAHS